MKTSPSQLQYLQTGLFRAAGEKRNSRRSVGFGLVVPHEDHPGLDCTIRAIGEHGARIGFARSVPLPDAFWLIDMRDRMAHDAVTAWRSDLESGLTIRDSFSLSQIGDPRLMFLKRLWLRHATR